MTTAKEIIKYMESLRNEEQRGNLMREQVREVIDPVIAVNPL